MFSDFPSAELKSSDGRYSIQAWTTAYEFPALKTGYDADWHRNHFEIRAGVFQAKFDVSCFEGKFLAFKIKELEDFSSLKSSAVVFEPTEPYVSLSFSFNARKNVLVKGFVQHDAGNGPKLEIQFELDLPGVDSFIAGLKEILKKFPPR